MNSGLTTELRNVKKALKNRSASHHSRPTRQLNRAARKSTKSFLETRQAEIVMHVFKPADVECVCVCVCAVRVDSNTDLTVINAAEGFLICRSM